MSHLIITHTDADGWVSAAIVNKYLTETYKDVSILNSSWNYGYDYTHIEQLIAPSITDIWMLDITLPNEFMVKYANRIHHFDHHASKINDKDFAIFYKILKEEKSTITLPDYLDVNMQPAKQVAACELIWTSLFPHKIIPRLVYWTGRYDIWNHDKAETTFAVHEYLQNLESVDFPKTKWLDPKFIELFDDDKIPEVITKGKELLKYKKIFAAQNSIKISNVLSINNINTIVANIHTVGSTYFQEVLNKYSSKNIKAIITYNINIYNLTCVCSCYGINGFDALAFLSKIYNKAINTEDKVSFGGHIGACGCVFKIESLTKFLNYLKNN